ncbi:outer membrane beta-barrel protein [Helicobacter cetorum]|uniref:outer membrane beta-barrel protein n=1 Tax=Helicobacter cetorum TaxID=138563 RepID=UPI000CF163F3|nr:outer membrane beta-barrel protein [Helicobacter cetorum]
MLKIYRNIIFLSLPLFCHAIKSELFISVGYQFSQSNVETIHKIYKPMSNLAFLNAPPFDPNLPNAQKRLFLQTIGGYQAHDIASMCQNRQALCNSQDQSLLNSSVQPTYLNPLLKPAYSQMNRLLFNHHSNCNRNNPTNQQICNPPNSFLKALQTINYNLFGAINIAKKNNAILSQNNADLNLVNNNFNAISNSLNQIPNALSKIINNSSFLNSDYRKAVISTADILNYGVQIAKDTTQALSKETKALKNVRDNLGSPKENPQDSSLIVIENEFSLQQTTQKFSLFGNGASIKLGVMHPFWLFNVAFKNKQIFSWDYYAFLDYNYSKLPLNEQQNNMSFLAYGIGSELVLHVFRTKKTKWGLDVYGGGGIAGNSYFLDQKSYKSQFKILTKPKLFSATYFNAFANTGIRLMKNKNALEIDVKFPFLKHTEHLYTSSSENTTLKYQRHIVLSVRYMRKF